MFGPYGFHSERSTAISGRKPNLLHNVGSVERLGEKTSKISTAPNSMLIIAMSRTSSAEMSILLTLNALMILASVLGSSSALTWESHVWTSDPWTGCAGTGTVDDDDD